MTPTARKVRRALAPIPALVSRRATHVVVRCGAGVEDQCRDVLLAGGWDVEVQRPVGQGFVVLVVSGGRKTAAEMAMLQPLSRTGRGDSWDNVRMGNGEKV